ncbi:MAG: hypothetical protein LUG51_11485 [Tannerellaceae bacterium]|nr:hypothetical protein [Tannerellaceae bacterium]
MRRRIYKINKEDLDYIIINNLKWYKEPLRVAGYGELTYTSGGKTYYYYTFAQAQQAASSIGKRIPTQAEYSALGNLGFSWDVSLKGIWLGLDANEKQESKTSLFLPALGNAPSGVVGNFGLHGTYWSSTMGPTYPYNLNFSSTFIISNNTSYATSYFTAIFVDQV